MMDVFEKVLLIFEGRDDEEYQALGPNEVIELLNQKGGRDGSKNRIETHKLCSRIYYRD